MHPGMKPFRVEFHIPLPLVLARYVATAATLLEPVEWELDQRSRDAVVTELSGKIPNILDLACVPEVHVYRDGVMIVTDNLSFNSAITRITVDVKIGAEVHHIDWRKVASQCSLAYRGYNVDVNLLASLPLE